MHLETNSFDCGEVNEVVHDAPSRTDSDDGVLRNGFHEESDNADNELSDNDDELPYNVEAFINPVFDIEDLNIEDHDDTIDHDSHSGDEQPSEGYDYYDMILANIERTPSSSEMSDDFHEDQQEIIEPEDEQQDASDNPERANLNSTQQGASYNSNNEDLNNVQQGELTNQEINITNDTERENLNSTQQGASYNSDNEDLNNVQQGVLSNQEINIINDIETTNFNSTQQEASYNNSNNEDLNNVQQGAISNLEISITNDINPNLFNNDCTEYIWVVCEDERIEPIAISTPSFGTPHSSQIYYGPVNSDFETPELSISENFNEFNYRGPSNSEFPSSCPPRDDAQSDADKMQTSENCTPGLVDNETMQSSEITSGPPVSNTTFSSQHHAAGNPGYATLHLLPILRYTLLNNLRHPTSQHTASAAGRGYPGPYSTSFTIINNQSYNATDNPDYTSPHFMSHSTPNNHGYVVPTPRNDLTIHNSSRNNAIYRTQHAYNDPSDNLASGTTQSTNYIAPDSSSGATQISLFSAPSSGYPASGCTNVLDESENVASQSPVTQVLSNDEAFGSTASYNYGGPGTSGYGAPVRNEPTHSNANYRTPQASGYEASHNLTSGTKQSPNYNARDTPADGSTKAPAYKAPNASDYGTHTSFDHNVQLSHDTSVPPAYLSSFSQGYGNPFPDSSNYNAPDSTSSATHYSQYNAPFSGCSDTLHASENVTSQSLVTQVFSSDEASGSTASYNYGSLSTSREGAPVTASSPQWFFSYSDPDFSVYNDPGLINYVPQNSTENNASGMSGDAELGPSGGQSRRRPHLSSSSQSRYLPNSTRRHGRSRGDKHGQ